MSSASLLLVAAAVAAATHSAEGFRIVAGPLGGTRGDRPTSDSSGGVKLAWYATELGGQISSLFRGGKESSRQGELDLSSADTKKPPSSIARTKELLKRDYDAMYFITGDMTESLYEDDCEFSDPFVSFKGIARFQRNLRNLSPFLEEKSLKIRSWDEEGDRVKASWTFRCTVCFPWRPLLAARGSTEHVFNAEGRIFQHIETWEIAPSDALQQLMRPGPRK